MSTDRSNEQEPNEKKLPSEIPNTPLKDPYKEVPSFPDDIPVEVPEPPIKDNPADVPDSFPSSRPKEIINPPDESMVTPPGFKVEPPLEYRSDDDVEKEENED